MTNRQTLNLYTYGHNNPLSNKDLDGHCTVDNEEHGWFWCAAHAIGLTQTVHEQAQVARNFFTVNQVTQNGEPVDPGKLSDQQVLAAFKVFNDEWRRMMNQGLTPGAALAAMTGS